MKEFAVKFGGARFSCDSYTAGICKVKPFTNPECPTPELSGVRGLALLFGTAKQQLLVDTTNSTTWQTLIDAANDDTTCDYVILLPPTYGKIDDPMSTEPGFGDSLLVSAGRDVKLEVETLLDFNTNNRLQLDRIIKFIGGIDIAYVGQTRLYIPDQKVNIQTQRPLDTDIKKLVRTKFMASWTQFGLIKDYDAPQGIFPVALTH